MQIIDDTRITFTTKYQQHEQNFDLIAARVSEYLMFFENVTVVATLMSCVTTIHVGCVRRGIKNRSFSWLGREFTIKPITAN